MAEIGEIAEVGGPLLLFRATSRFISVWQIMHPCCEQGEFLVQVLGGSWQGVSVLVSSMTPWRIESWWRCEAGSILDSSRLK